MFWLNRSPTFDAVAVLIIMQTNNVKILVVDDEPDILEFIGYNLRKEGYQVEQAGNGFQALDVAKVQNPHLILLDIMMPEMDGVATCHRFRNDEQFRDTLIAFLTARHEEYSEVAGLEAGADDYIRKPVSPRVLSSRVKAILRRHRVLSLPNQQIIQLNGLRLDKDRYQVSVDGQSIELARKEFEILWLLASDPGKVFSRGKIYSAVWGFDVIVGNRTIDVHISKLRTKLDQKYIRTIKGVGYKLEL